MLDIQTMDKPKSSKALKPKNKGGRPSGYKPEFCSKVIEVGKQGAGKCEMSVAVCGSYMTFQRWQEEHPEFLEAVKEATRESQAWWERRGREATFGKVPGFNATAFIFNMKNRFKEDWSDRAESGGGLNATLNFNGDIEIRFVAPKTAPTIEATVIDET